MRPKLECGGEKNKDADNDNTHGGEEERRTGWLGGRKKKDEEDEERAKGVGLGPYYRWWRGSFCS